MTLSYRSPHLRVASHGGNERSPMDLTMEPPPEARPAEVHGVEWLMRHIIDVIAAGPMYDGKLSPVWAQMVRLYGLHLGAFGRPPRPLQTDDDKAAKRRERERQLRDLIPAIADLLDEADAAEVMEEPVEEMVEKPTPPAPTPETESFELAPLARLDDPGAILKALGRHPRPETLTRVLKLALDASAGRAALLRGAGAEPSAAVIRFADHLNRKWRTRLFPSATPPPIDPLDAIDPDLFETPGQTWRRLLGIDPNLDLRPKAG